MLKAIIAFWFRKKGWRFTGNLPKRLKKSIIIVAPNTSRQDFLLAVGVGKISRFHARILLDKKYFSCLRQPFLKALDAYPFDYDNAESAWRDLLNAFVERKKFCVVYSPEGNLKRNDDWDDGFHDLALKLDLPIVMVALDYRGKKVKFHNHFYPSNDKVRDIAYMKNWFYCHKGKYEAQGVFIE